MRNIPFILFALTLTIFSSFSWANSLPFNEVMIDRGTYVSDSQSSLDWLKLSETQGISPNEMNALLAPSGRYAGWRYATVE